MKTEQRLEICRNSCAKLVESTICGLWRNYWQQKLQYAWWTQTTRAHNVPTYHLLHSKIYLL